MEEILSSIRRVIARDEAARDTGLEERFGDADGTPSDGATEILGDDDVLDLTEMEAPTVTTLDGLEQTTSAAPLVSEVSEDATRQAIGQLTAALHQGEADVGAVSAAAPGMTIEALAEAALRPMLKTWLDANLPPLVERLVAREIARITGGRI
jgi:uncharacterized protein